MLSWMFLESPERGEKPIGIAENPYNLTCPFDEGSYFACEAGVAGF